VRPVSPQVSTPVPAQHANMRCIMHALRRERAGPLRYVHLDCLRSQSRPVRGRPPHVHMCVYDHVPVDLALSAPRTATITKLFPPVDYAIVIS